MRFKILLATLFVAIISVIYLSAQDELKLRVMGTDITSIAEPRIIDGRTMVPVRAIFEAMGANVEWDGENRRITGTKDDTVVIMEIDNTLVKLNSQEYTIDAPPIIIEGKTLAPARFVAECFGYSVNWDEAAKTVNIVMYQEEESQYTEEYTEETSEDTTETTTEVYISDLSMNMVSQVKADIKTVIGNYGLGNSSTIARFKAENKKNIFHSWANLSKHILDSKYIEEAKKFYNELYTTMTKIDNASKAYPKDNVIPDLYATYKEEMRQLYLKWAAAEKVSDLPEITDRLKEIRVEIQNYIDLEYKNS